MTKQTKPAENVDETKAAPAAKKTTTRKPAAAKATTSKKTTKPAAKKPAAKKETAQKVDRMAGVTVADMASPVGVKVLEVLRQVPDSTPHEIARVIGHSGGTVYFALNTYLVPGGFAVETSQKPSRFAVGPNGDQFVARKDRPKKDRTSKKQAFDEFQARLIADRERRDAAKAARAATKAAAAS